MIEWKRIDKNNPPKGTFLFIYDGSVFEGWTLFDLENNLDVRDDYGYPCWESNENYVREAHGVRWYADINLPEPLYPELND